MNLAVVLVSDQTIPNVVYLKEIREKWDKVLFITTEGMERRQKSEIIVKALDNCQFDRIVVDENMVYDVSKKLEDYFSKNNYNRVFVNITGGTKIMSLGTYMFFKDKSFVENIVYLPIGKTTYKQLYPMGKNGKAKDIPIEYRMSVKEYLDAIGIDVEFSEAESELLCNRLFNSYFGNEDLFADVNKILMPLRADKKERRKFKKSENHGKLINLLKTIGIEDPEQFDFSERRWIDYFSGGWFEDYVYYKLKKICVDDIRVNAKVKQVVGDKPVPNEIDVIFTKNNNLHIIECKSGDLENYQTTDALYKVAQINSHFGLGARPFFVSLDRNLLDKDGRVRDSAKARADVLRVRMIDRNKIKSGIDKYFAEEIIRCK